MRIPTIAAVAVLAGATLSLAACGGSGKSGLTSRERTDIAKYQIAQVERMWHQAEARKSTPEMMTLWAPHAIWQLGPAQTLIGKAQIRKFWNTQVWPVAYKQHWFSDTATFRIHITVSGDKGSIYFECHEIDAKTHRVVAVVGQQADVSRIGGHWLITKSVGSSPTL